MAHCWFAVMQNTTGCNSTTRRWMVAYIAMRFAASSSTAASATMRSIFASRRWWMPQNWPAAEDAYCEATVSGEVVTGVT
ncbi:hypothetical protein [Falsiroseomonas tokyonensis]|uniref:Secreted protein n=1 Tax=Falsiroseomonas tokyonensis TaxID=430521 RepID=A0ABV7C4B9_9PROT|nr:hypothetical protein [Falsiroseomonas tokyonensis]MBU8541478.1 hypothetical protein [Falsiroseomonas tokyonensis]